LWSCWFAQFHAGFNINQWVLDTTKKPVKRELFLWYEPPTSSGEVTSAVAQITPATRMSDSGRFVPDESNTALGTIYWCDRKAAYSSNPSPASPSASASASSSAASSPASPATAAATTLVDAAVRRAHPSTVKVEVNHITDLYFGKRIQIFVS
jgi:hypothetical protein